LGEKKDLRTWDVTTARRSQRSACPVNITLREGDAALFPRGAKFVGSERGERGFNRLETNQKR